MRAPFQDGDFPGPVKYGYLNVGGSGEGPADLLGRDVFCLHPHQTAYVVPADGGRAWCPTAVPVARAVLAGHRRDRGQRAVGRAAPARRPGRGGGRRRARVLRGAAASRVPGVSVTLVDVDPSRAAVAAALGVDFALPDDAPPGRDLVVHTSATSAGLQRSLDLLAPRGHGASS